MSSRVLTFHQSTVLQSDIALLSIGQWLNDNIISFAFEYTFHRTCGENKHLLLVDPGAAFVIAHEEDMEDLTDTVEELDFNSKKVVLIPVNDNTNVTRTGGCHWSLLVLDVEAGRWLHVDSASQHNYHAAKRMAEKLRPFLKSSTQVVERVAKVRKQSNGWDCGDHVICNARAIAEWFIKHGGKNSVADCILSGYLIENASVAYLRDQIQHQIEEIASYSEMKQQS